MFLLKATKEIGKKTIVKRVCALKEKAIVYIDLSKLEKEEFKNTVFTGCREAFFLKAYICLHGIEKSKDAENSSKVDLALDIASKFSSVVFILSEKSLNTSYTLPDLKQINISLSELESEESIKLWERAFKGLKLDKNLKVSELANKFNFTPFQIKNVVNKAANYSVLEKRNIIDSKAISYAAKSQVSEKLSKKAVLIKKSILGMN